MSPEQVNGKRVDRRSDIWAFGVVLYELLTGERPFAGETTAEILSSVMKDQPSLEGVPERVRPLIARCLAKIPGSDCRRSGKPGSRWNGREVRLRASCRLPDHPIGSGRSLPGCWRRSQGWAGGPAQTLADVRPLATGNLLAIPNWGADGNVVFSSEGNLKRVSSEGGKVETLAAPDRQKGEQYYTAGQLLPGGRAILSSMYSLRNENLHNAVALDPRTGDKKTLIEKIELAFYLPDRRGPTIGHIVYYDPAQQSLMAVIFDAARLAVRGSPVPVMEGVQRVNGPFGAFALSDSGTLAYVPGNSARLARTLVWVDRKGTEEPLPAPMNLYGDPRLSPDGGRVAIDVTDTGERSNFVWVYDLARGTLTRIAADYTGVLPVWTPDGQRLIFVSRLSGAIVSALADGSGPSSVLMAEAAYPDSISPDGKVVALTARGLRQGGGNIIRVLPLSPASSAGGKPQVLLDSAGVKQSAQFSPDGRVVAYQSNESGREEIYVQSSDGPGGKWTISSGGGSLPRWSRSGRELFYRNGDKMMAVDIQLSPAFRPGKPSCFSRDVITQAVTM